ncbi:hypothetical protein NP511_15890 [Natrinema thermotolerans]|uniref:Small CPxCG-related zinc finger protein n=1 Tax=Natrinema thermotolerans TaxID=121872 RepID=A0AAF0T523_9EURY|nr:HVO_2523 family zinc finger protein [Natrinema thermotolerans]WMT06859.1 hypothetical protein NP511_15890 [Natrinema thermotolerans]
MTADAGDGSAGGRETAASSDGTGAPRCPHCEAPMYKRHCKYACPQHGVIIDCSDPFR